MPSTTFLGVRLHLLDEAGITERIRHALLPGTGMTVAYAHFDVLLQSRREPWLRDVLNGCTLTHPDGFGCALALRAACDLPVPRVAGSNLYGDVIRMAAELRRRVYFLGGPEDTARRMLGYWEDAGGDPAAAASHHGYITPEDEGVLAHIRAHQPHLILVAMGSPLQFAWMHRNRDAVADCVLLAAGGGLDFLAGTRSRGPVILRRLGLEWTHRLLTQPLRYGRRYLLGIPLFAMLILRETLNRTVRKG